MSSSRQDVSVDSSDRKSRPLCLPTAALKLPPTSPDRSISPAGRFINTPIELLKIRQQSNTGKVPSTWRLARHIYANEGRTRGLYRGFTACWMRDIGFGPYFLTYEVILRWLDPGRPIWAGEDILEETEDEIARRGGRGWGAVAIAGAAAGVVSWTVSLVAKSPLPYPWSDLTPGDPFSSDAGHIPLRRDQDARASDGAGPISDGVHGQVVRSGRVRQVCIDVVDGQGELQGRRMEGLLLGIGSNLDQSNRESDQARYHSAGLSRY